jgi:hypothetical protein
MNLLQTASGKARIFNLGRPMLRDESLVSIAMDAVRRIARATGTAVPGSAEEVRARPYWPVKGDHFARQGVKNGPGRGRIAEVARFASIDNRTFSALCLVSSPNL